MVMQLMQAVKYGYLDSSECQCYEGGVRKVLS